MRTKRTANRSPWIDFCRTGGCWLVISSLTLAFAGDAPATRDSTRQVPNAAQLKPLIQQLGDASFYRRQEANRQLRAIGLQAIEPLLEATYDPSSEIRLAAKRLLGQMRIRWVQPSDPDIIREVLLKYEELPDVERQRRIEWLASLEDGVGFASLCRLARFEDSNPLAHAASLELIEQLDDEDPRQVESLLAVVGRELADSQRAPVRWLQQLADDIRATPKITANVGGDSNDVAVTDRAANDRAAEQPSPAPQDAERRMNEWLAFLQEQRELQQRRRGDQGTLERLSWIVLDRAEQWQQSGPLRSLLTTQIQMRAETEEPTDLVEAAHWLLDRDQADLFEELIAKPYAEICNQNVLLLYARAEAAKQQGQDFEALVQRAFDRSSEDAEPLNFNPVLTWFLTANILEQRGLADWAEPQYRRLLEKSATDYQLYQLKPRAARLLAELLHDRLRPGDAAEVLKRLLDDVAENRIMERILDEELQGITSRMHYFLAEQHRRDAEFEKQKEELLRGLKADPTDADVLIAMHRLARPDAEWDTLTSESIASAVKHFEKQIVETNRQLAYGRRSDLEIQLASALNQVAWLISNTEGDFKKANAYSHRSLELRPQSAGYLDTLGRTYYALDELSTAIRYQSRAARLEPFTQQIRRQLALFQAATNENLANQAE